MDTRGKLSFMTWNTNGLKTKIEKVKTEIEKHNCHVAFIQETHIGPNDKCIFKSFDSSKSFFTTYRSTERGVAILIKKDILGKSKIDRRKDASGSYIVVKCTLRGQLYTLVSVYVHQVDARPLKKLRMLLENFAEGILLIGGDFNIALNPYLDRESSTVNERHIMLKPTVDRFMTSFHLVDVWRRLHPIACQYSHCKKDSRLDYVFVPEESMQYVESCEISKDAESCVSDHESVLFEIRRCKPKSSPSNILDVNEEEKKMNISKFVPVILEKWLRHKQEFWGRRLDLTYSQDAFKMIHAMDVEKAIQSLAVNENQVRRPDRVSLSFYKSYSYALIPYLCVFYHSVLQDTMTIPKSFITSYNVAEQHYIFNVDYLILATIMARWLSDHLDSHSADYSNDKESKPVLLAFKTGPKMIPWTFLQRCLRKAQEREPPLQASFKIDLLEKILKNSKNGKYKLLHWGCPLTPVLMRLCLTHVAERFIEFGSFTLSEIHICNENVIVRVNENVSKDLLAKAEGELPTVYCRFVADLKASQGVSSQIHQRVQSVCKKK